MHTSYFWRPDIDHFCQQLNTFKSLILLSIALTRKKKTFVFWQKYVRKIVLEPNDGEFGLMADVCVWTAVALSNDERILKFFLLIKMYLWCLLLFTHSRNSNDLLIVMHSLRAKITILLIHIENSKHFVNVTLDFLLIKSNLINLIKSLN